MNTDRAVYIYALLAVVLKERVYAPRVLAHYESRLGGEAVSIATIPADSMTLAIWVGALTVSSPLRASEQREILRALRLGKLVLSELPPIETVERDVDELLDAAAILARHTSGGLVAAPGGTA